jgi:hypothetical protein
MDQVQGTKPKVHYKGNQSIPVSVNHFNNAQSQRLTHRQ